ncbi:bifunctional ADP-dependent NAD(P)H-hydrate dehydratase/NAD(P)H-hydrate epimerase [Xanthomonas translucens pv. undulosa]|uniref:bifunctional ADP-dependent NAD(P)H-hydrate dehydratase/NAD(P)H-hydrate epimerase n=1 Tax=Xanthomonas campestris pv. translucens TaxID=343 RepID=UPI0006426446|nr:bifunctional ADP-dependent NAD(P)H-hydrate dehydratase/NAD(P)H-hydrate epimerase [Xanthomonas translucens]AKK67441.1 carbohydrate kinase [Xanthomonas translucens pv. undulosa]AVY67076.1 carbohydrate kinase [Xanthomonas translucens pv. undulosa]MCT8270892.1 bifunctional ADP-dependent NAD(P)H-hydrate dehydratase/NAD(P)H-hydrate epimerase [Xanthomonas translucens pv. undulosa]QEO26195.1 bifunctional ADP-dependent NAD(P)H-hydrate dehydratase/NAD(P)H-hydrate epimerase [Xanthomonas translucens pv.
MSNSFDLYDTAAARRIDAQATALLGGDGYPLMQRAGQAAWQTLLQHWPQAQRILVACGSGNNGGDGYVLARLAHCAGRRVRVLQLSGPQSALAQRACTDYIGVGGRIEVFDAALAGADVVVDALLGIGLNRAPDAELAALLGALAGLGAPVLALDVPSGVDAEHGSVPGAVLPATLTVQFIVAHAGLHTGAALNKVGATALATLEVPAAAFDGCVVQAQAWTSAALAARLAPRRRDSHKGDSGHVLCIGGNLGSGGAVMLTAEAALRSGAGLVSVATRAAHVAPLLARCPEAMTHAVEDGAALAPLLRKASVLALGPGLGQDGWAQELWRLALAAELPVVIDADALNLLAQAPRVLPNAVLTPHPGEAGRLLGIAAAEVQRDRFAAAATLAKRYQAVVVLKGAGSIVAAPGQVPRVIAAGNPGMAVGGMGDLLTGVIAALRAQGLAAFEAASVGALLHAAAGDRAAAEGQRGLLPSDLLPALRHLANPETRR